MWLFGDRFLILALLEILSFQSHLRVIRSSVAGFLGDSIQGVFCQGITPSNSKGGLPAPEAGALSHAQITCI